MNLEDVEVHPVEISDQKENLQPISNDLIIDDTETIMIKDDDTASSVSTAFSNPKQVRSVTLQPHHSHIIDMKFLIFKLPGTPNTFSIFVTILLSYSFIALSNAQNTFDVCGSLNSRLLISYSDAVDCLNSFPPLSPDISNQIIDTTLTYLNLYPFYDVVENSPEKRFPSNINIKNRLEAIRSTTYSTERAFHEDVSKLYIDFRDAHSLYSHCFMSFNWAQPWSIVAEYPYSPDSKSANNKPILKFHSLVTENWLSRLHPLQIDSYTTAFKYNLGFDPKIYVNTTILEIDGQNPIDFVSALANIVTGVGVKDVDARFNALLSRSGWDFGKFVIKDDDSLEYLPDPANILDRLKNIKLPFSTLSVDTSNLVSIRMSNFSGFFGIPSKRIGIWVFPTVAPTGIRLTDGTTLAATQKDINNWLDEIVLGFELLQSNGYTNLIIDVSQNGGGYICYAQFIAQLFTCRKLLFSDIKMPLYEMRYSDLFSAIASASVSSTYSGYFSSKTKVSQDNSSEPWFTLRSQTLKNTPGQYSQIYRLNSCDTSIAANIAEYKKQTKIKQDFWSPKNVSILSDGNCGSACSFITRALVEQKNLTVFVYGGMKSGKENSPFAWCGFDSGPIVKEIDIRKEITAIFDSLPMSDGNIEPGLAGSWVNLVAANSLSVLPLLVNWSLPISATFGATKLDRMTEWLFEPASAVVNIPNSFVDTTSLWLEVSNRIINDSSTNKTLKANTGERKFGFNRN
ncbi:hypothetical protein HK096_002462, partial [Nowakowskiella sp. JEL0078]